MSLVFLSHMVLGEAVRSLLQIAIPDQNLKLLQASFLSLLQDYLKENSLHLYSNETVQSNKQIIYMKSCEEILKLQMCNVSIDRLVIYSEIIQ